MTESRERTAALAALSVAALDNADVQRMVEEVAAILGRTLAADGVLVQELREGRLVARVPVARGVVDDAFEIGALVGEWGEIAVYRRDAPFDDAEAAFLVAGADVMRAAVVRCARDELVREATQRLRTPLATLLLKLESLEPMPMSAKAAERLAGALKQTHRVCAAVERVEDVARVVHGRVVVAPEDTDVAALVRAVSAEVSSATGERVDVVAPAVVRGRFDRAVVAQVLRHLLSHGKRATVRVDADPERVRVAVDGPAPDELSALVARAMVEAHGGKLSSPAAAFELPRMASVPIDVPVEEVS